MFVPSAAQQLTMTPLCLLTGAISVITNDGRVIVVRSHSPLRSAR
jgi:hypothetical protein